MEHTLASPYAPDPNRRPCELAPIEAFSDDVAPDGRAAWLYGGDEPDLGRNSSTVRFVFASRCCGYRNPPTAGELYDAMRRTRPTERDKTVLTAWMTETTDRDWLFAWYEQAYSWRMLAGAVKLTGWPCWERIRRLNTFAARQDLVPAGSLPVDR